jgi:predicted transcriptional regulator
VRRARYAISITSIISFYLFYRRNIESAHGHEVERLRKEYSQEDKDLIEEYLEAKKVFNLKSEGLAQKLEEKKQQPGMLGTTYSPYP